MGVPCHLILVSISNYMRSHETPAAACCACITKADRTLGRQFVRDRRDVSLHHRIMSPGGSIHPVKGSCRRRAIRHAVEPRACSGMRIVRRFMPTALCWPAIRSRAGVIIPGRHREPRARFPGRPRHGPRAPLIEKSRADIYCLTSDGEWQEGSMWEALIFLAHRKLPNITVFIDLNGLQGFGSTRDIASMDDLARDCKASDCR